MVDYSQLFVEGGRFKEYLKDNNREKEFATLTKYVSAKYRCITCIDRLNGDVLSTFKKIESIKLNYQIPQHEAGYEIVTRFIKNLIGLSPKAALEVYMNKNDRHYIHIHYILSDPIISEFFESIPWEDWYDKYSKKGV